MRVRLLTALLIGAVAALGHADGLSAVASEPRFLTLPFDDPSVVMTAGWLYDQAYNTTCNSSEDPVCHRAIDFARPARADGSKDFTVLAAAGGQAVRTLSSTYGNVVYIAHNETFLGERLFTLYAHVADDTLGLPFKTKEAMQNDIARNSYDSWTTVVRGQSIAKAGGTGTGADGRVHLHFELQRGGYPNKKTDPYGIYGVTSYYPSPCVAAPGARTLSFNIGVGFLWTACPPVGPPAIPTMPVAVANSYGTPQGVPLTIDAPGVLVNDSVPSNFVSVTWLGVPQGFTDLGGGGFRFTPSALFTGAVHFSYSIHTSTVDSAPAAVTIQVTPVVPPPAPPVAVNDSYTVAQGGVLTIGAPGVLSNDTYPAGSTVEFLPPAPSAGALTFAPVGLFILDFTASPTFTGAVTLRYLIHSPNGDSNVAIVTVTVPSLSQLFANAIGWTVTDRGRVTSMPLPALTNATTIGYGGLFNALPRDLDDWYGLGNTKPCYGGFGGSGVVPLNDFRLYFRRPLDLFTDMGLGTANCTSAGRYFFMIADSNTRQNLYYYSVDWNGVKPQYAYTYTNGLGFGLDVAGQAWNVWSANGSNVFDWRHDYVGGYLHYQFKVLNYAGFYCSGSCRFQNIWSKDPTTGFNLSDVVAHDSGVFPESNQNDHVYQVDIQWSQSGYHVSVFDVTTGAAYSDQDYVRAVTPTTYSSWTWGGSLWAAGISYPDEEGSDHASQWTSSVYQDGPTGTSGGGGDVRTDALPVKQPVYAYDTASQIQPNWASAGVNQPSVNDINGSGGVSFLLFNPVRTYTTASIELPIVYAAIDNSTERTKGDMVLKIYAGDGTTAARGGLLYTSIDLDTATIPGTAARGMGGTGNPWDVSGHLIQSPLYVFRFSGMVTLQAGSSYIFAVERGTTALSDDTPNVYCVSHTCSALQNYGFYGIANNGVPKTSENSMIQTTGTVSSTGTMAMRFGPAAQFVGSMSVVNGFFQIDSATCGLLSAYGNALVKAWTPRPQDLGGIDGTNWVTMTSAEVSARVNIGAKGADMCSLFQAYTPATLWFNAAGGTTFFFFWDKDGQPIGYIPFAY